MAVIAYEGSESLSQTMIKEEMNMIDWKRKLTSRKFWMALVAFITSLLLAFGVAENHVTQVAAIIMAGADVAAYILAEGLVDAKEKE